MFIIPFTTIHYKLNGSATNTEGIISLRMDRSTLTRGNVAVTARSSVPFNSTANYGAMIFELHLYNPMYESAPGIDRLLDPMFSRDNDNNLVAALEISLVNGFWETRWCTLNNSKNDYVPTIPYPNVPTKKYRITLTLARNFYTTPLSFTANDGNSRQVTPCVTCTVSHNNYNYWKIVGKMASGSHNKFSIITDDEQENFVTSNQVRLTINDALNPSRTLSFTEILSTLNKVGSPMSESDNDEFIKW